MLKKEDEDTDGDGAGEGMWNNVSDLYGTPASTWFFLSLLEFPGETEAVKDTAHKLDPMKTWSVCHYNKKPLRTSSSCCVH